MLNEIFSLLAKYILLGMAILSSISCLGMLYLFSEKEEGKGFLSRRVEITSSFLPLIITMLGLWVLFFCI